MGRLLQCLPKRGLLLVGVSYAGALRTRAGIHQAGQLYLAPLPQVGEVPKLLREWVKAGLAKEGMLRKVVVTDEEGTQGLARGYEVQRTCTYEGQIWEERVPVVQSFAHADKQRQNLEERLQKAEAALLALTPPLGRGKRQIRERADLHRQAEAILEKYAVKDLLSYTCQRECQRREKLVGRGRSGPNRERQVVEEVRDPRHGSPKTARCHRRRKSDGRVAGLRH